ncbi:hypothetical protein EYF80_065231 [Liparis tanakae]|uniref:Uncharacterized protein n=1 Tax=Liparis tanakae TaxID=230148 RepID=A0A4Z2E7L1_9TELE|nr:hypothetical protein EYF80_065231 [Liparis tanakae]
MYRGSELSRTRKDPSGFPFSFISASSQFIGPQYQPHWGGGDRRRPLPAQPSSGGFNQNVLPLRLRLCWMVAWEGGGGGGRGRGRDCREAPMTLTRKGPG